MPQTANRSIDDMIANCQNYGGWAQQVYSSITATTAATVNSGGVTLRRFPGPITVPSMTGPVVGAYCSNIMYMSEDPPVMFAAYATNLGSINISGGAFTDGAAMPTYTVKGGSVTTAGQMTVGVVTTAITATTPTITITYTDQDGNTGQTATLVLPTSPTINTAFFVDPRLAAGDSAIRDITNLTRSTGTVGTITFFGLHIISAAPRPAAFIGPYLPQPSQIGYVPWIVPAGTEIHFYQAGVTTTAEMHATLFMVPDV